MVFEGVEDLDVHVVGRPNDDLLVHHVVRDAVARVFFRSVRIESMPARWVPELARRIVEGDYEVRKRTITVALEGKVRVLG